MSAPSPNRPINLFGNTTNNDDDDTNNPSQASPITTNVCAVTQQNDLSTYRGNVARNLASFNNKRRKVTIRPATSMLLFLRESYIDAYTSE